MFPEYMEIAGKKYKINTDYRYALACFEAINDGSISDIERAYALVEILLGCSVPDMQEALKKIAYYLSCGKEEKSVEEIKKDMDFKQDEKYIYASFMSDYGIDLDTTEMHWWKYCALISGFTEESVLSRVRALRNLDMSEYKDPKQRAKIKKAKEQVKLKEEHEEISEEEIEFLKTLGIELKGSEL